MTNEESEKDDHHKLQVEFEGGGPGSIIRTAIGAGSEGGGGPHIDPTWMPDTPWWFFLFEKKAVALCREHFKELDLAGSMVELEQLGVPPISRLAFCLYWDLIDCDRDGFGRADLKELMMVACLGINPFVPKVLFEKYGGQPWMIESFFDRELSAIDKRVAYRLWQREQKQRNPRKNSGSETGAA